MGSYKADTGGGSHGEAFHFEAHFHFGAPLTELALSLQHTITQELDLVFLCSTKGFTVS